MKSFWGERLGFNFSVVTDFTARYQDVVHEASVAAQREKRLTTDLEEKEAKLEELLMKMEEDKNVYEAAKDQVELDAEMIKSLKKKLTQADKKELEYIEIHQKQTQDVEESNYERDSSLKREKLLTKEIETLTRKCQEQSNTFREKLDYELQT